MDGTFEMIAALQYRVKALRHELDEFHSGERYKKLQSDHRRVIDGYIREISKLRKELADAHAQTKSVLDIWYQESEDIWEKHVSEMEKKDREIQRLEERYWETLKRNDDRIAAITKEYEEQLSEKDAIIEELKSHLAHDEALLGRDSTNTNLPTGQTPPGKKKHIPNSRNRNTGRKKGGQPGHKKHTMETPSDDEIDEEIDHKIGSEDVCPTCKSDDLVFTGEYEDKFEVDIEIKVIKRKHRYWVYECQMCGERVRSGIDPNHRAECQYGVTVQAISLAMMNSVNSAINKVPLFLSGITNREVMPCEGYIAKLQPRAAKGLETFMKDLFRYLINLSTLYWDDTVVMADKVRICLRFYGDERIAYYVAHDKKDLDGVLEDGVLEALLAETRVVHDHCSISYNERFVFINIECNAHLQRDLQKTADETGHTEPIEIKNLITETIKERNELIEKGIREFAPQYVDDFNNKLDEILSRAKATAEANNSIYSGSFERAVISRIINYRENFFAWVTDFSIPTTNNLSERALRGVKTKMRVSGQFASTKTANNYARIRSYIETCRRNGINEIEALIRLCSGNPYTVDEILLHSE